MGMSNQINEKSLRYIVFLLNPGYQYMSDGRRVDCHNGAVFCSLKDAQEYATGAIESHEATRFVIGSFVMDPHKPMMYICCIETHGFKGDRKYIGQLELFSLTQ
jgi:hypothetical protein